MRSDLDLCDLTFVTASATLGCIRGYSLPNRTAKAYRQIRTIRIIAGTDNLKLSSYVVIVCHAPLGVLWASEPIL